MYLRRLYDLSVLSVAGTLSITSGAGLRAFLWPKISAGTLSTTSNQPSGWFFYGGYLYLPAILPARGMHQILL
ncbi:hypothetical protein YPPY100_3900 [Yersinia pestis PY-100]|nr:hypothetical protein YPPY100_3900 [Yersinia pestis PY-100]